MQEYYFCLCFNGARLGFLSMGQDVVVEFSRQESRTDPTHLQIPIPWGYVATWRLFFYAG